MNELRQLGCSLKFVDECLKGVPKTAASISLEALKDYVESACAIGSKENEEYVKVIGCMNSVGKNVSSCMGNLKRDLQRAVVKAPTKDVIPHVCCLYGVVVGCAKRTVTPCKGVGGDVYATSLLKKVFGRPLAIVCDKYTGNSDACKALPTLPELGPNDPRAENYAELLIRAANTISRGG